MPAAKVTRPKTRASLTLPNQADPVVSRSFAAAGDAISDLQSRAAPLYRGVVDLTVGINRINHGLERVAKHLVLTPTVADATFAYALTGGDARTALVTVIGVAQPGAGVMLS